VVENELSEKRFFLSQTLVGGGREPKLGSDLFRCVMSEWVGFKVCSGGYLFRDFIVMSN